MSNGISPFLQKLKDTVIVTCSKEICFTKKVVKPGAHEEIRVSHSGLLAFASRAVELKPCRILLEPSWSSCGPDRVTP